MVTVPAILVGMVIPVVVPVVMVMVPVVMVVVVVELVVGPGVVSPSPEISLVPKEKNLNIYCLSDQKKIPCN